MLDGNKPARAELTYTGNIKKMILLSDERGVDCIAICVIGWIMGDLEGLGFWFLAQYALEDNDDKEPAPRKPAGRRTPKKQEEEEPAYETPFDKNPYDDDDDDDDEKESLSTYL